MPDGVKISNSSHPLYRKTLQQICENQDAESIAISAIRSIKQDIKQFGQGGSALIAQATSRLSLISGNSLLRGMNIDWDEEFDIIAAIAKDATGDPFHVDRAAEACSQVLIRAEAGEIIGDVKLELEKERMLAIYKARVGEAPINSYCKNADYEQLRALHESIQRYIVREFENDFVNIKPGSTSDLLEIDIIKV